MKKMISLFADKEKRMPAVLILCFLVIAAGAVFIGNELVQNEVYYVREYENRQQEETELLGAALEGRSREEMIGFIRQKFPVSGSRWVFLYDEENVVFAQNDTTTRNLNSLSETESFLAYLEDQEEILTISGAFFSDEGESFWVGIITDRDHALSAAKVTKHEIYIILSVSLLVLILAGGLIFVTGLLNARDRSLAKVNVELTKRNEQFTEYEEEVRQEEAVMNAQIQQESHVRNVLGCYDMDVVRVLLQKSSDTALFPITFLFARVVMEERYYGRDEIFSMMNFIKERLKSTQIMAEVGKGRFVAILYKTGLQEAERQKKEILDEWESSSKSRNLKMELKLYPVLEGEDPLKVFEKSGFDDN